MTAYPEAVQAALIERTLLHLDANTDVDVFSDGEFVRRIVGHVLPFIDAEVRRRVAEDIRAEAERTRAGDPPCDCETCRAYEDAARIAEGGTSGEGDRG